MDALIGVNVIGFVLCFLCVGLGRFLAGLGLFLMMLENQQ